MYGRYGQDGLNRFISYLAIFLCILSFFVNSSIIYFSVLGLFVLSLFRSLSKNFARRRQENQLYEKAAKPVKRSFKYCVIRIKSRKTHRVFTCGKCHSILRIPKSAGNGGKVEIKCPKCGGAFTRYIGGNIKKIGGQTQN